MNRNIVRFLIEKCSENATFPFSSQSIGRVRGGESDGFEWKITVAWDRASNSGGCYRGMVFKGTFNQSAIVLKLYFAYSLKCTRQRNLTLLRTNVYSRPRIGTFRAAVSKPCDCKSRLRLNPRISLRLRVTCERHEKRRFSHEVQHNTASWFSHQRRKAEFRLCAWHRRLEVQPRQRDNTNRIRKQ